MIVPLEVLSASPLTLPVCREPPTKDEPSSWFLISVNASPGYRIYVSGAYLIVFIISGMANLLIFVTALSNDRTL